MQPNAAEEIEQINGWVREGIPLDYWFLDAGWYPSEGQWWNTGTWEPDPARFPRGLREVSDHAHAHNMQFVCWFEPERVRPGTWLWENRSEWLLGSGGAKGTAPQLEAAMKGDTQKLFNLGNPEARQWLIDHIDGLLKNHRIEVYRQDFNFNPLEYWRANDAPDRQGVTENAHVTGYLAYWDELLRRDPDRWIDTCASGGRRNDLETLRRSVPLLRSDYFQDPVGQQCHTYGLSLWMPYYGSGAGLGDLYLMRSSICPAYRIGCDMRNKEQDFDLLRRTVKQFRQIEPYLLGDYYPLTPYSLTNDVWMAWQFDRPEMGEGVVQAFRRAEGNAEHVQLKLYGLDAAADYSVRDFDQEQPVQLTGRELMDAGLTVRSPKCPGAVVIVYKKVS
jgi:alpha-galactosidase